jgi:ubiquinone/menaquinone biosynthesis C-methylase UbiE
MEDNYLEVNKALWNAKTEIHINSEFYNNENFLKGKSSLNKFELDLLGDLTGKRILHLQCHFGQDTMSMARMGASCVGVDISEKAIDYANETANSLDLDASFVTTDLYNAPKLIDEKFDIVFTSYGTIGWLPDINKWAEVVTHFLKPGGQLIFVEFHPVIWMFDDDFKDITYRYFQDEPIIEFEQGTYADKNADIQQKCISWNHGLAEVMGALLKNGLTINDFQEYDYSPYDCFNNHVKIAEGKYRIEKFGDKIPMVYSIVGTK